MRVISEFGIILVGLITKGVNFMIKIGLMFEGQDGLNWERWSRLLQLAEDGGFHCVFRSDHYTNPVGEYKDSLELWVSLTYAASHTKRIEFGPLVTPVTFRHPTITTRMAVDVDTLSNGRLTLGMGAGWQEREHHNFGVPFYDFKTRYAMLTDALEVTTRLIESDTPVNYDGEHFSLDDAIQLPRPTRKIPILIGGNGPKRTLPLAAKYADEWNGVFIPPETYQERNQLLDNLLAENGRDAGAVKRSLMMGTVFGKDDAAYKAALEARGADEAHLRERGVILGTSSQWIDQIGKYNEVGVECIMLQWLNLDDLDGIELVAKEVLPHFHR